MEPPFHYVRITAFCYGTERQDMVRRALSYIAHGEPDRDDIQTDTIEGQFGDTITVMYVRMERSRDIRMLSRRVLPLLTAKDIEERVDNKWFFHLRFDKEAALEGRLELSAGTNVVTLKGKIQVYPASRERAIARLRDYVESNNH
jgi:hypothetical protein